MRSGFFSTSVINSLLTRQNWQHSIEEAASSILSRKSDDRERGFRGPKPAGRFESGRKRGYDDREEFRAREDTLPREHDGFRGIEE